MASSNRSRGVAATTLTWLSAQMLRCTTCHPSPSIWMSRPFLLTQCVSTYSQMPGVISVWCLHILFTANQTVTVSYTNESFSIPTTYSYHCNSEQMLNTTNGKLLISKVQFEAFKNDNKQTFSRTKVNDIHGSTVLQWFIFNFRIASHTSMETSFRSLSAYPSSPWLSWCWLLTSSAVDVNRRAGTWACNCDVDQVYRSRESDYSLIDHE